MNYFWIMWDDCEFFECILMEFLEIEKIFLNNFLVDMVTRIV